MRNICKLNGCEGIVHGFSYCNKHYRRLKKRGTTDDRIYLNKTKCLADCTENAYTKGYCKSHYKIAFRRRMTANENRRRTRKLNNGIYLITNKEIEKLYSSSCYYCDSKENIQIDHVIPISRGGRHSIGNIVPACMKCNVSKGNKYLFEWKVS